MRVAMWYNNQDVRVEELPTPQIGHGELLVRVEASGICGSDALEWYRLPKAPLVLGHEIAGTVAVVGEGIDQYTIGDRVCVAHHVPCNVCHYCRRGHHTACDTLRKTNFDPGGFSEYLRLPSINVDRGTFVVPEEVSFEEASFTEPLACVIRGQRIAGLHLGDSVLVLGCGIAGLLHIQLARASGAALVVATDIADYRMEAATHFGADAVIPANKDISACFREINDGRLADIVIVCTGAVSATLQALESIERGGTILFFALLDQDATIPLAVNKLFFRNDVTLTTSYAGSPADYAMALELIRRRRIQVQEMITHRLGLEEISQGFQLLLHPEQQQAIKIIIQPQR